ncbi:glycosyl hydrolase, family 1, partial [Ostertagia ostertagi]
VLQDEKVLQVTHYRLSICWTRILPTGLIDNINEKGVEFYRDLLQELKTNGIAPIVTLFHADYPYALYLKGGWVNSDSIQWYQDFCRLCFERFGDLVKYWITFNEISAHAWWGVTKIEGNCTIHLTPSNIQYRKEEFLTSPLTICFLHMPKSTGCIPESSGKLNKVSQLKYFLVFFFRQRK